MAQTMLYVNEHLHDQLYDGDDDPSWIRSFAPGDYLVVATANGDLVTISGHPAERGTFELFVAAFGLDELASSERFATVAARMAELRRAARAHRRGGGRRSPTPPRSRSASAQHGLAAGKVRDGARAGRVGVGGRPASDRLRPDRRGGTIRIPNPPWRFDDVAGEITGDAALPRRGQPGRAQRAARLRRRDDRRAGGGRRPVQPPTVGR